MKVMKKILLRLWDYAVITFACAVYAVAFNCFFESNSFTVGGFTGLAQCIHFFFNGLPIGAMVLVMNIPLLIIGIKKQGIRLLITTLFAIVVSSLLIDVTEAMFEFPKTDPLLGCVFGGVFLGVSMGLMLKKGATTGGTELAARLLKYRFHHLSIGRLCLIIDILVVGFHTAVFSNINNSLYGVIAMYISSVVMDTVIYGSVGAKLAMVISESSDEIRKRLLDMNLGVTMLDGTGGWTGAKKNVVLCVFKRNQIAAIKSTVNELDPTAFIIVCEAHEVLGEGFGEYSPDSL